MQVKKDFQDTVLSYRQDDFFRKNMYANFGDIGAAVKELVDEFQKQTNNSKRINTIEDMQVCTHTHNRPLQNVRHDPTTTQVTCLLSNYKLKT